MQQPEPPAAPWLPPLVALPLTPAQFWAGAVMPFHGPSMPSISPPKKDGLSSNDQRPGLGRTPGDCWVVLSSSPLLWLAAVAV
eukprot:scaffold80890_cov19-Tisochrysis_lutea.AAC.1